MGQEELLSWTRRQPFEPFILELTNGEWFVIRYPDMVLPLRAEVVLAKPHAFDPHRGAEAAMISYSRIVRIEALGDGGAGV